MGGRWQGEVNTKIANLETDLADIPDPASFNKLLSDTAAQLRGEREEASRRIHERLNDCQSRLDGLLSGLQSQRQEWDQLRGDVRTLLRSEATTGVELSNAKARLAVFEEHLNEWSAILIRLQSDLTHLSNDMKRHP